MKAIRLRTEHLKEAMGVDFTRPELTWNCEGGIRQTAWRILAASGKETVWDSGKVAGSSMRGVSPCSYLASAHYMEGKALGREGRGRGLVGGGLL